MGRVGRAVLDGVRLRCPACRAGRMTPRWWSVTRLHDACPRCGIPFLPGRGENSGGVEAAVYVTVLLGSMGVMLLVILGAPPWALAAWVGGAGVLAPLLTYRNFRGAWVGAMWGAKEWGREGDEPRVATAAWPWDE